MVVEPSRALTAFHKESVNYNNLTRRRREDKLSLGAPSTGGGAAYTPPATSATAQLLNKVAALELEKSLRDTPSPAGGGDKVPFPTAKLTSGGKLIKRGQITYDVALVHEACAQLKADVSKPEHFCAMWQCSKGAPLTPAARAAECGVAAHVRSETAHVDVSGYKPSVSRVDPKAKAALAAGLLGTHAPHKRKSAGGN